MKDRQMRVVFIFFKANLKKLQIIEGNFLKPLAIFKKLCYNMERCIVQPIFIYGEVLKWGRLRALPGAEQASKRSGRGQNSASE